MRQIAAGTRKWDDIYKKLDSLTQKDRAEIELEIEKIVAVLDEDFVMLTPKEQNKLDEADKEIEKGMIVDHNDIDWK